MREPTPENSTNVRFEGAAAGAALAVSLWCGFIALLACTGALRTLASDIPLLAGFACAVALLAYAVDAELRSAMERQSAWLCMTAAIAAMALCAAHAALLLALSPIAVVCLAAAAMRRREPRIRPAPATSPGATRAAP